MFALERRNKPGDSVARLVTFFLFAQLPCGYLDLLIHFQAGFPESNPLLQLRRSDPHIQGTYSWGKNLAQEVPVAVLIEDQFAAAR